MISDLLDRPIAFHRCLVDIAGSIPGAVMLSQAIYWSKRSKCSEGQFYKTAEEWEEETSIAQKTQTRIRAALVKAGVFEERYERLTHRLWFRVNMEKLNELLIGNSPMVKLSSGDKTNCPVRSGQIVQSSNEAESISETTYREHESDIDSPEQKELLPIETSEEEHKRRMIRFYKTDEMIRSKPKKGTLVKKTERAIREAEAEQIFAHYPNPLQRPAGVKAVALKLQAHEFEMLMEKTKEHARAMRDRDPKFIPLAKNWFRNDGFLEVTKATFPDESKNQPRILSATERRAQIEAKYGDEK